MIVDIFYSERIKQWVSITFTHEYVIYIDEDAKRYQIKRDIGWHFNEDGMDRAKNWFDDPRFNTENIF